MAPDLREAAILKEAILHSPSNEGVEGEVGDKCAVEELDDARKHQKDQKGIHHFEPFWRVLDIRVV